MKRLTTLLFLTALVSLQLLANPAHRASVMMPQPDGTMVTVKLVGARWHETGAHPGARP